MTEQELTSLLLDAFKQAPSEIRMFFEAGNFDAYVEDLKEVAGLEGATVAKVANETFMVLVGINKAQDFPQALKSLGLTDEQAASVVALVAEDITKSIEGAPALNPSQTGLEAPAPGSSSSALKEAGLPVVFEPKLPPPQAASASGLPAPGVTVPKTSSSPVPNPAPLPSSDPYREPI